MAVWQRAQNAASSSHNHRRKFMANIFAIVEKSGASSVWRCFDYGKLHEAFELADDEIRAAVNDASAHA